MSTAEVNVAPNPAWNDPAPASRQRGAHAIAQTIGSKILIQAINAGTGIITARALMPAGRGQLAAMILWSQFLSYLSSLGIPSSLVHAYRRHPEKRYDIVATGLLMSLGTGILVTLIGVVFLPHWMQRYPAPVIRYAQWFLIITPICSLTYTGKSILEAAGSFTSSNLMQILTPVATIIPLIVLALFHALTPFNSALCYVVAAIPPFYYLMLQVRPYVHGLKPSLDIGKLLLSFGVRSYGIDILGTLAFQVDQVLVVNLLTPAEMGSYVVILSLTRTLNVFQNSVVSVLFPKASGLPKESVLKMSEKSARVSMLVTSFFAVVVYIFGPILLRVLYGKAYMGALNAFRILLIEVTLSGCVFVLAQAFMALGRPGIVTFLQGTGLSLSIPLMLVLIPRWHILGAVVALLASTIARLIFVFLGFRLFLKAPLPDLMPRLRDFEELRAMFRRRRAAEAA
ncbi:oligosaccharide flippase family protein [Alloacidobacterium dinghuense]|uniref:Oligosaccharide flippase family protein n=1 Tax=Alloacidobacterium dinghuense TaxID=2763107 RepID=A0A7G8BI76_9BACT|nr:oligosaccharide flippase family protein [Alloacidobacterium dinghuense]QNI32246.1 oligosaccharide flippase family protein [Alloacidobacterium dinghuense]